MQSRVYVDRACGAVPIFVDGQQTSPSNATSSSLKFEGSKQLVLRRLRQGRDHKGTQGLTQRPPEDSARIWMPLKIPGLKGEGEEEMITVNSALSLRSRRPVLAWERPCVWDDTEDALTSFRSIIISTADAGTQWSSCSPPLSTTPSAAEVNDGSIHIYSALDVSARRSFFRISRSSTSSSAALATA